MWGLKGVFNRAGNRFISIEASTFLWAFLQMSANDPKRTLLRCPFQNASVNLYDTPSSTVGAAMKRREFIALLSGAAATWPFAGWAQQPERIRRVGILLPATADNAEFQTWIGAF